MWVRKKQKGANIWEVLLDGRFMKEEKPFVCFTFVVSQINTSFFYPSQTDKGNSVEM